MIESDIRYECTDVRIYTYVCVFMYVAVAVSICLILNSMQKFS